MYSVKALRSVDRNLQILLPLFKDKNQIVDTWGPLSPLKFKRSMPIDHCHSPSHEQKHIFCFYFYPHKQVREKTVTALESWHSQKLPHFLSCLEPASKPWSYFQALQSTHGRSFKSPSKKKTVVKVLQLLKDPGIFSLCSSPNYGGPVRKHIDTAATLQVESTLARGCLFNSQAITKHGL